MFHNKNKLIRYQKKVIATAFHRKIFHTLGCKVYLIQMIYNSEVYKFFRLCQCVGLLMYTQVLPPPPTRKSKRQRRIWGVSKSSNVPIKREKAVKNLFGHDNIGCVGSCPILLKT